MKNQEIEARLLSLGAVFHQFKFDDLLYVIGQDLINGKIIGWVQGKMELGPRALGARSILADPRSLEMQKTLNLKIKFRESFRPFAPAVIAEASADWFELEVESPYMLLVAPVAERHRINLSARDSGRVGLDKINVCRSSIPQVTNVDYSARIQTVNADSNPRFYKLLKAFRERTGCPVLVNTSFNIRGEPIVCTPEDAFKCFMSNEMDAMAVGEYYLKKMTRPHRLTMGTRKILIQTNLGTFLHLAPESL